MDQDQAYPRVRWDYLRATMRTMNLSDDLINIIDCMYATPTLKLKINGRTDTTPITPSNGLAQGCPLSPFLYLLVLQGFLSLLDQNARVDHGIQGITLPDNCGSTKPGVLSLVSGFADDLGITLKNTQQLTLFKPLLTTYENGSGAKNSWEKSLGIRLGALATENTLPEGWIEGKDICL